MESGRAAFAAADLGASSGRIILGRLADGRFELDEVHRFANGAAVGPDGALHWDATTLYAEVVAGFEEALTAEPGLASVGIDTWGVDYGRLGPGGRLLEEPFCYRDGRTDGVPARFFERFPAERLYTATGVQVQPFNTVFQLAASAGDARWADTERLLFVPDLFNSWLTGVDAAEVTLASTSGLLDVTRRQWSREVLDHLDETHCVPARRVLPPLVEPGTVLGPASSGALSRPVPVVAVASHDTASAVVAVPCASDRFAYISSGTWSLVGVELERPILSEESRRANFTNELGAGGTVRYLKNVMGLWVLQECRRAWDAAGQRLGWPGLVELAEREPPLGAVVDIDDESLLAPGDMPARLRALASASGQELSAEPGPLVRCILDSLALAYRRAVREVVRLSGRGVDVLHVVGGGSQNALLCQLTAEATGLTVVAGPSEGTALGNLLVQAGAVGAIHGGLPALREVAVASCDLTIYRPGVLPVQPERWDEAERSLT